MPKPDFPEFLAARLDELEETWREPLPNVPAIRAYFLADVEAKRAILERHKEYQRRVDHIGTSQDSIAAFEKAQLITSTAYIRTLCRPFADHHDWPGDRDGLSTAKTPTTNGRSTVTDPDLATTIWATMHVQKKVNEALNRKYDDDPSEDPEVIGHLKGYDGALLDIREHLREKIASARVGLSPENAQRLREMLEKRPA